MLQYINAQNKSISDCNEADGSLSKTMLMLLLFLLSLQNRQLTRKINKNINIDHILNNSH